MHPDEIDNLCFAIRSVAHALTPADAMPGHDEAGGNVSSLTEATMGVTAGLFAIAHAIDGLAAVIENKDFP